MRRRKQKKRRPEITRAIRRTLWALGIPTSIKRARGLQAEKQAWQALTYHQKAKTEFPGQRVISTVRASSHLSLEDYEGIDITVGFQIKGRTEDLPIQVQNWWKWKVEKKFRQKGICLVVIRPGDDGQRAREIVFGVLSRWLAGRQE